MFVFLYRYALQLDKNANCELWSADFEKFSSPLKETRFNFSRDRTIAREVSSYSRDTHDTHDASNSPKTTHKLDERVEREFESGRVINAAFAKRSTLVCTLHDLLFLFFFFFPRDICLVISHASLSNVWMINVRPICINGERFTTTR